MFSLDRENPAPVRHRQTKSQKTIRQCTGKMNSHASPKSGKTTCTGARFGAIRAPMSVVFPNLPRLERRRALRHEIGTNHVTVVSELAGQHIQENALNYSLAKPKQRCPQQWLPSAMVALTT